MLWRQAKASHFAISEDFFGYRFKAKGDFGDLMRSCGCYGFVGDWLLRD